MLCSQTAILYSKCQLLSDSSRVHPSIQHFYRNDVLRKHHTRKHPDTKYDIPPTYTCFHYEGSYRKDAPTHSTTSTAFREPEETVHDLHDDSPVCPADLVASLLEDCRQCYITAPFNNMRTLKSKAQPTNAFFATVNQMLAGSSQLSTAAERAVIKSLCRVHTTNRVRQ